MRPTADTLAKDVLILRQQIKHIEEYGADLPRVQLALQQAKRVQREARSLVRLLAEERDDLDTC